MCWTDPDPTGLGYKRSFSLCNDTVSFYIPEYDICVAGFQSSCEILNLETDACRGGKHSHFGTSKRSADRKCVWVPIQTTEKFLFLLIN